MTTYRVTHVTAYDYDAEMTGGHMVTHLVPRATQFQTVLSSVVTSEPNAADPVTWIDVFGNLCTYLSIEQPHTWLEVGAVSEVTVFDPILPADVAWEQVAALTTDDTSVEGQIAQWCRHDSPLVRASAALAHYARPSFGAGVGVIAGLRDLSGRIFADFFFDPEATDVSTPLDTVLTNSTGCLPRLRAPRHRLPAFARVARPLCERLHRDHPASRCAQACWCGCIPCLVLGVCPRFRLG